MNTTTSLPLPPRTDASPELLHTPTLPVVDLLRTLQEVMEVIRIDCLVLPDEYLREAIVIGGGE